MKGNRGPGLDITLSYELPRGQRSSPIAEVGQLTTDFVCSAHQPFICNLKEPSVQLTAWHCSSPLLGSGFWGRKGRQGNRTDMWRWGPTLTSSQANLFIPWPGVFSVDEGAWMWQARLGAGREDEKAADAATWPSLPQPRVWWEWAINLKS